MHLLIDEPGYIRRNRGQILQNRLLPRLLWTSMFYGSSSSSTANYKTDLQQSSQSSGADSPVLSSAHDITFTSDGGDVSKQALLAMEGVSDTGFAGLDSVATSGLNLANNATQSSLKTVADIAANQITANQTSANSNDSMLSNVLAQNASLAANAQTGGAAASNSLIKWAIAAAVVVLGIFFWNRH